MIKITKILIGLVAAFLLFVVVDEYIGEYRDAYNEELTSMESHDGEEVMVEIPKDSSVKDIAAILHEEGLIRFERAFVKRLQDSQYRGKLRSGTFKLHKGMNTLEMMEIMAQEDEDSKVLKQLVIPEGYTVDMIAAKCQEEGICSKTDFVNAVKSVTATDFDYLADVPSGSNVRYKLEGYLFPATYDITKNTTAVDLVRMMLNAFEAYYTAEMKDKATEKGLTSFQVLTMASIVEREAKLPEERPKIASVLYNRINTDMLLQVDSSVFYAVTDGRYDIDELSSADLSTDSPYNTYVYKGLPAGPICNPGLACITAVLYPDDTNYYYFYLVDEEKGEHVFSETLDDHYNAMIGGTDTNGDGKPDIEPGQSFEDNNAADDVWSNQTDD
ncbi:UPF0755 protein [Lachnospiraceae bacterium NE2001]|nr:UPF0755 protein [Lachnospiraceae bacterium NE2001]